MVEKNARHFLMASNYFDKAVQFNTRYKDAYLENAYSNLEMRRTDVAKALPCYIKAVELDVKKVCWAYELGLLYYNLHEFANAAIFMNRAAAGGYPKRYSAIKNHLFARNKNEISYMGYPQFTLL